MATDDRFLDDETRSLLEQAAHVAAQVARNADDAACAVSEHRIDVLLATARAASSRLVTDLNRIADRVRALSADAKAKRRDELERDAAVKATMMRIALGQRGEVA